MAIIIIKGLPRLRQRKLEELYLDLREATCSIKELELKLDHVVAFSSRDSLKKGAGEQIVVFVVGLFSGIQRTDSVRGILAGTLERSVREWFPKAKMIQCLVMPFDQRNGFSYSALY